MEIRPSLTALLDTGRAEKAGLLKQLRPGQVLQATVLQTPRAGVVELQIGLTALLARSRVQLQAGTQLQLAVTRLTPRPELRVLTDSPAMAARERLLAGALPRQLPLADALTGLARAARPDNPLPQQVRSAIDGVLGRAAGPGNLDAAAVRDALRSSGLFLDALLARGELPVNDLKLDLLRLLRLLRPPPAQPAAAPTTPPDTPRAPEPARGPLEQLLRLIDGAVARIQTQQAASLPPEAGTRQVWQFELPLLCAQQHETVMVRLERDGGPEPDRPAAQHGWSVSLRFDFATTGPIHARIVLAGERVSSTFWCERPATDRRLRAGLQHLEHALVDAGLQVDRLHSVQGTPPDPVALPRPASNLLDTRA